MSVLFAGSMIAVIGGLASYLGETYLAMRTLRIGPPQVSPGAPDARIL
jgi:hypothetical protein